MDSGYRKNVKKIFGADKLSMLNEKLSPYNLQIHHVHNDTYQLQQIHNHQTNEHEHSTETNVEIHSNAHSTKQSLEPSEQSDEHDLQEHKSIDVYHEQPDLDDEFHGDEVEITIQEILCQTLLLAHLNGDPPMTFYQLIEHIETNSTLRCLHDTFLQQKQQSSTYFVNCLRQALTPSPRTSLNTILSSNNFQCQNEYTGNKNELKYSLLQLNSNSTNKTMKHEHGHEHNEYIDETMEQQNEPTQQKMASKKIFNIIFQY
jgi:hypothetical protein